MSFFQAVVDLVTGLAWPVTVGVIAFMFRNEVRSILKAPLSRIKAGPVEAVWEQTRVEVQTATAAADDVSLSSDRSERAATSQQSTSFTDTRVDRLSHHAATNPAAVILDSYALMEDVLRDVLATRRVEGVERLLGIGLASRAVQAGVISPSTLESIQGITVLRNLTAHGQAGDIDEAKARDYLSLVDSVIWTILENARRGQGG